MEYLRTQVEPIGYLPPERNAGAASIGCGKALRNNGVNL